MRGHIITCLSMDEYNKFIHSGYAGVMPILLNDNDVTTRKLSSKIGTNWDVIADLKRVKIGDYIFLHTQKNIFGPFRATTHFLESPQTPNFLKSHNLKINYWLTHYRQLQDGEYDYFWKIGIESIDGVTKHNGFSSMELFKLRSIGLIQSIPQRFQYHDKPKIVKPLLNHELQKILDLLDTVGGNSPLSFSAMDLNNYVKIKLDLDSYNGIVFREKILEAWIMENITSNGDNPNEYRNICETIGNAKHFVNSIFTYYTNFMDVLFYDESENPEEEYCHICNKYSSKNKINIRVIELKRNFVSEDTLYQIQEYKDWAVRCLANGDESKVKSIIIGSDFSPVFHSQTQIKCIKYDISPEAPFLTLHNEVN